MKEKRLRLIRMLHITSRLILLLALLGIAGCQADTALQRDYGNSWAHNLAVQIADPEAALVQTPAVGMSPKAGSTIMEGYNKSYERKEEKGAATKFITLSGSGS
ncbi:MAG: hypothetical protein FJ135_10655 [Deltaproteobacteria bacterium]|nr:hypothetical protein [Deltaproteobacteria bacterium]